MLWSYGWVRVLSSNERSRSRGLIFVDCCCCVDHAPIFAIGPFLVFGLQLECNHRRSGANRYWTEFELGLYLARLCGTRQRAGIVSGYVLAYRPPLYSMRIYYTCAQRSRRPDHGYRLICL